MYAAKSLTKVHFRHSISHSERILKVEGEGNVELDTVINAIDAVFTDPEFDPKLPIIVDLRNIYFHPSYDELMAIKDHLLSVKDQTKSKIGLVVNDDLYFVAIMICMFCRKFGLKMKSFRTQANAESWISETAS